MQPTILRCISISKVFHDLQTSSKISDGTDYLIENPISTRVINQKFFFFSSTPTNVLYDMVRPMFDISAETPFREFALGLCEQNFNIVSENFFQFLSDGFRNIPALNLSYFIPRYKCQKMMFLDRPRRQTWPFRNAMFKNCR